MKGDKYLLTGGTGFLGTIIRQTLSANQQVNTLGRSPGNDYQTNLVNEVPAFTEVFDIVVHNAGKAHVVPKTIAEKEEFFHINVRGTENLLKGLAASAIMPGAIVYISSIAVYGLTGGVNISEDAPLAAEDPYGKSKAEAEKVLGMWCSKNGVSLTILRLPLIAGKNPPGNLGAMIRGMKRGLYFSVAGGKAKKSMVLAEDVAAFIPTAAMNPGIFNLTDGYHPSFAELESHLAKQMKARIPLNIPAWAAKVLGRGGDVIDTALPGKAPVTSAKIEKVLSTLTFNDHRARSIGWRPRQILDDFRIE